MLCNDQDGCFFYFYFIFFFGHPELLSDRTPSDIRNNPVQSSPDPHGEPTFQDSD